ncbi:hypothetical protein APHCRT_1525 [Anaplasma phagocytophilum str. CRT53-1]|uniref:Lipoprotein n=1 Tax=Anaplasma phagocytophilum str. CRT53-1 TaxID=1359157 RepID=A0A0F3PL46_ANAPH|nr:hypothetical protein APHCRT_1525 [Anaplasma phagocytophilum str. CRT53-1]
MAKGTLLLCASVVGCDHVIVVHLDVVNSRKIANRLLTGEPGYGFGDCEVMSIILVLSIEMLRWLPKICEIVLFQRPSFDVWSSLIRLTQKFIVR